jgi:hypothetical protein
MEIRETATGSLLSQVPQCRNPVPLLLSRRLTEGHNDHRGPEALDGSQAD